MQEEIIFTCPAQELSCIIGNLFAELKPPCDVKLGDELVIRGITHSGKEGCLFIESDRFRFLGDRSDLEIIRENICLERRCKNGRL